jgi:predicted AAA+ superfamily ATPase
VKLLADRKRGHRFLLLGSSQILLPPRVRETLAGRAPLLELRPLVEFLESKASGAAPATRRVGLVVTRGREIERLGPRVWAIPDWRLFGPAA